MLFKMKITYLFIFFILISCIHSTKLKNEPIAKTQAIKAIKEVNNRLNSELDKDILLDNVLKQLKLNRSKIDTQFLALKIRPENSSETILIIPENVDAEDEGYDFILNSHIIIANSKTGKIKNSTTERWTSDAVMLTEATIDTAPYIVTDEIRAFGIRTKEQTQSQPNPYNNESLSLFIKSGDSLKKILNYYDVNTFIGEWNTICEGEFLDTENILIMSKEKTNGFYNLIVKSNKTYANSFKDRNGDCLSEEKLSLEKSKLIYNGIVYNK